MLRIGTLWLALACTGCMTLDTLSNRGYEGPWSYSGTRADLEGIGATFLNLNLGMMAFFLFDLPFSFVADTLALPVTLPRERRRLAELESRMRVDVERPPLVQPEPGEAPEATASRLFQRCRTAVREMQPELLDCYSVAARITVRGAPGTLPRQIDGSQYKLELRQALARQSYVGEVIDWIDPEFERDGAGVRVRALRTTSYKTEKQPQTWKLGPCADGGWRIVEEDGVGWPEPAHKP